MMQLILPSIPTSSAVPGDPLKPAIETTSIVEASCHLFCQEQGRQGQGQTTLVQAGLRASLASLTAAALAPIAAAIKKLKHHSVSLQALTCQDPPVRICRVCL